MRIPLLVRYVALPGSAAVLALTGCASSSSGGGGPAASATPGMASPLKIIQAAYTTTTSAKTARSTMSVGVGLSSQPKLGGLTVNGVEDFALQNADETVSDAGQGSELRVIGNDFYLQIPQNSDFQPSFELPTINKPWVHIRVPDSSESSTTSVAELFGGSAPDPAQFVKLLTDVSSSVQRVGSDLVRGQQSAHYRLTFDAAKTGKLNQAMDACDDSGSLAPKDTTPVDVWIDAQGRLTRMTVTEKAPLPGPSDFASAFPSGFPNELPTDLPSDVPSGLASEWPSDFPTHLPSALPTELFGPGGTLTISLTIELYDYGTPVHVTPPPADQTQNVPFNPTMLNGQTPSDCSTP